jgi:hypothetical protein
MARYTRGEFLKWSAVAAAGVGAGCLPGRSAAQSRVNWRGRTHFFAIGAQALRRILIDHARGQGREKRGGEWQRVTLSAPLKSDESGLDSRSTVGGRRRGRAP